MTNKRSVFCFLTVALLLGYTDLVNSEQIFVSAPSFEPFYFKNKADDCAGVVLVVLNDLMQKIPLSYQFVPFPYARIIHSLKAKKLDAALIFQNESLQSFVDYLGPLSKAKVVVLSSKEKPILQYNDLKKLDVIAVIRKASFAKNFDHDETLHKVPVESYEQAITMLKTGRVDGVVGSIYGLDYALRKQHLDVNRLNKAFVLGEKEWWLHVRKGVLSLETKEKLQKIIDQNYQTDLIYQTYQHFMSQCIDKNSSKMSN